MKVMEKGPSSNPQHSNTTSTRTSNSSHQYKDSENESNEKVVKGQSNANANANANTNNNSSIDNKLKPPPKSQKPKKTSNKTKKEDKSLDFIWICTVCKEAECITHPDSPLLVCEGSCQRPFHYPCAGLPSVPSSEETWICHDCTNARHECCVCHEYGVDGVEIHKCNKTDCGLFFHEACLSMYDVDVDVDVDVDLEIDDIRNNHYVEGEQQQHNGEEHKDENIINMHMHMDNPNAPCRPKFTCPAHSCWTCSGGPPPQEDCCDGGEGGGRGDNDSTTNNGRRNSNNVNKKKKNKGRKKKKSSLVDAIFCEKKEKQLFVSTKKSELV